MICGVNEKDVAGLRGELKKAGRIVVKVGTSTLTYGTGRANLMRIEKLARALSDIANQGRDIVLVTSGAIGVGTGKLKLKEMPESVREKQAAAAVGQCELMRIYSKFFSEYGHTVGQILLTRDVVDDDHRRQNVVNTFETLFEKGVIPIVNENDSVAIDEIEYGENRVFGDNDTLSAIVSKLIKADILIILTDTNGFYNCDPKKNSCSELLNAIGKITPEIEKFAGGVGSRRGTGGMITKLSAAKIAMSSGVNMVLANGEDPGIIPGIITGEDIGTLFIANKKG